MNRRTEERNPEMTTTPGAGGDWTRRYHPASSGAARLVCFPHAGGSASYFFPVSAALAPEFEVVAVQYPGRQDRRGDAFIDTIDALADAIHHALGDAPEVPTAFFGHSMGAVLAFEVTRRFEAQGAGRGPDLIFASGRRAPSRVREEDVHLRTDEGIIKEMRELGGTDSRVLNDPELQAMVLPAVRNDYRAVERYSQGTEVKISAPVVVLTADDDPRTTVQEAAAWAEHTTASCEVHTFTGGHFYLERQQAEVIGVLRDVLRIRVAGVTVG
jgi:pyochelin biosynthesis protein PchC